MFQQTRSLNLHEHYSLGLLDEEGVPVPRGAVASSPAQVRSVIDGYGKWNIYMADEFFCRKNHQYDQFDHSCISSFNSILFKLLIVHFWMKKGSKISHLALDLHVHCSSQKTLSTKTFKYILLMKHHTVPSSQCFSYNMIIFRHTLDQIWKFQPNKVWQTLC